MTLNHDKVHNTLKKLFQKCENRGIFLIAHFDRQTIGEEGGRL